MFGVPLFLLGLGLAAVPVAIHLLARQRTRILPWGAMSFLMQSTSSASAKRNRLRDLLLLLLRTLAILFLALTFAQPLVSRLWVGGDDLETTFIWDISLSTTALDDFGQALHEATRESLLEELEKLPDRSKVRVLLAGAETRWMRDGALVLSSANRRLLESDIERQKPDQGGSQLADAVLTALAAEAGESISKRQLVIAHDAQRQAWQADDEVRWRAIRDVLASDRSLSLRALPLASEMVTGRVQLAVTRLEAERDVVAANLPTRFQATLRNFSPTEDSVATVVWRVDGREFRRDPARDIPAGESIEVEETLKLPGPGSRQVSCEVVDARDPMVADNERVIVVEVPESLPVLVVDDTERTEAGQILPSEFLSAAMGIAPNPKGKKDDKSAASMTGGVLFEPRVVGSESIGPDALADVFAVIIAEADSLPAEAAGALRQFVEQGGGLWLMMDTSRERLPEWNLELLAELGLEAMGETSLREEKEAERPIRLIPSDTKAVFTREMAGDRLDLHRAELRAVHQIGQRAFLDEENLLRAVSGEPILLSLGVGAGTVMLQTTDLSRKNTNLPVLQSFVPLVRQSLRESLRGALPDRNFEPGEPIRIPLVGRQDRDEILRVREPDGTLGDMVRRGWWHEFGRTRHPGIYTLVDETVDDPDRPVERFAVRRPEAESDPTRIAESEVTALVEGSGGEAPAASEETRSGQWPLAWLFAILTGCFFLAEALLAHWIHRRREASAPVVDLKPIF